MRRRLFNGGGTMAAGLEVARSPLFLPFNCRLTPRVAVVEATAADDAAATLRALCRAAEESKLRGTISAIILRGSNCEQLDGHWTQSYPKVSRCMSFCFFGASPFVAATVAAASIFVLEEAVAAAEAPDFEVDAGADAGLSCDCDSVLDVSAVDGDASVDFSSRSALENKAMAWTTSPELKATTPLLLRRMAVRLDEVAGAAAVAVASVASPVASPFLLLLLLLLSISTRDSIDGPIVCE
mmetsp:Transcript_15758/g.44195  ORF Transcript_15758/g.44195 Transcript_15758/m.44195 type:complete len:240 (+) Transcript_15758:991-1710(+)